MERKRNSKFWMLLALIGLVIGITVAFATMSTYLTINGSALMETASWNVRFVEGTLNETVIGNASVPTTPIITDTNFGTYKIILTKPDDMASFTFDVTNEGTIDAKIGALLIDGKNVADTSTISPICTGKSTEETKASEDATIVCGNLTFTFKYAGGSAVKVGDTLMAGETRKLELLLSYSGNTLPSDDVEITGLNITIIYEQA